MYALFDFFEVRKCCMHACMTTLHDYASLKVQNVGCSGI